MVDYLKFLDLALLGDPLGDSFFSCHSVSIRRVAYELRRDYPFDVVCLYRGLESGVVVDGRVLARRESKYLSFTEDLSVARGFGGCILECVPDESEVLFHYSWLGILGISSDFLSSQREVILLQRMRSFDLCASYE